MSRRLVKLGCVLIGLQLLFLGKPVIGEEAEDYLKIAIKKGEKGKIEVIFLNQKNQIIDPESDGLEAKEVACPEWVDLESISLLAIEKSPMQVWVRIGNTDYCFQFNDQTGAYEGPCD